MVRREERKRKKRKEREKEVDSVIVASFALSISGLS